jgi:hypothetical protein
MSIRGKRAAVVIAAAILAGVLSSSASAQAPTIDARATIALDCRSGRVVAEFDYSGFNPRNMHLQATEAIRGAASASKSHTLTLDAQGNASSVLRARRTGNGRVTASTVVVSASGRVKARASKTIRCTPPPPPPPPPEDATSARLIGPCGDPMYAAVFNNRDGTRAVTFRWRYHAFGSGYTTLVKRVGAGRVFRTGYKHVTGSTVTTIRAHGDTLVRERTAPAGNYRPCR